MRLAPPDAQVPGRRRVKARARPEDGAETTVQRRGPSRVPSLRAASDATVRRRSSWSPPTTSPGRASSSEAGVDIILVGDSVANTVLGYEDTLHVDIDDMAHHTAAVARAKPRCLIVGDMPWMSYHLSPDDAVRNAATLIRAGAQAVKLEGGRARLPVVEAIIRAEIPVMGHLGLTPQSVLAMGGFRVQGKSADAATAAARRGQGAERGRLLRLRDRGGARRGRRRRHRGRSTSRPSASGPGRPATARSWSSTTCSGSGKGTPAQVRAPVRRRGPHRHRGHRRLRRRRAQRELPERRRELPRPSAGLG